jgi:hypothetical protein
MYVKKETVAAGRCKLKTYCFAVKSPKCMESERNKFTTPRKRSQAATRRVCIPFNCQFDSKMFCWLAVFTFYMLPICLLTILKFISIENACREVRFLCRFCAPFQLLHSRESPIMFQFLAKTVQTTVEYRYKDIILLY